jgi:hypothetical protein
MRTQHSLQDEAYKQVGSFPAGQCGTKRLTIDIPSSLMPAAAPHERYRNTTIKQARPNACNKDT